MSKSLKRLKAQKGRFVGIPYDVAKSRPYAALKAPEAKLLFDLMVQFNGHNNGELSACHTLMKERTWAKSSLYRACSNLQHAGFIVVTRQGTKIRGMATLVAVTWIGIDEPRSGIEYDGGIDSSHRPLNYWCKAKPNWKHQPRIKKQQKSTLSNMENKKDGYFPYLELLKGGATG